MHYTRNASCFGLVGNLGIVVVGLAAVFWFVEHYTQLVAMGGDFHNHYQNMLALLGVR